MPAERSTSTAPSYRDYRFPCAIIAYWNWPYFRFNLSFRDIQEMMLERGSDVCDDSSRCDTPKASSQYTPRSRIISDQSDTLCGPSTIEL